MLAFLSAAFLIYGAMHLYALSKIWLACPHSLALGLSLALLGSVMTFSPLILWYVTRQNWDGAALFLSWVVYLWMGFLFLFCCIALVFDLGHAIASLTGFTWPLTEAATLRAVGLLTIAVLGYGLAEARRMQVEEIAISTPKLASGRVKIAQLSDLHLGMILGDGFLGRVISRVQEFQPDIVVATGDIVDGQGNNLDEMARQLSAVKPSKGAFAVIGNHEYYAGLDNSLRFLRNAGFTVLRGGSAEAGGIVFVGVDDPSAEGPGKEARVEALKVLASTPKGRFVVLLKHQPVVDRDAPFDLQLSGHIHGGQIFPFGLVTWFVYGVRTGLTELADGRRLYVSRGAGTWGPPIRIFAAPEITLITIESQNK